MMQFKQTLKHVKNGSYNVGTGISRSFQEIADILQDELNTSLETEYFNNPFNGYQTNTKSDISSTIKYLDFEPQFSLEAGVKASLPEILRIYSAYKL